MSINLTGTGLTVDNVVQVARGKVPVTLDPEARKRIVKCRALLEDKIQKKEIMYGVNTGIGELANVVLTQEQVEQYQRYIIYSHAAGYGKPMPEEVVRAAILSRDQLPLPRPFGAAPRRHRDPDRAPQQGRHARHVREGLGRRLRRPLADGPDGPRPDGRGRGLLQGRAAARRRGPQAGRHRADRPSGPRRPGHDQRLERHRRHGGPDRPRRPPLAEDVRDRGGHDARGPQRQHEGLRRAHPQDPRLSRRPRIRRERPAPHRRERDAGAAGQEGPGRLQPPQHAPGRRRGPRRPQVGPLHVRDRAQRGGRQPRLLPRRAARPDRGEFPGRAHGLRRSSCSARP